MKYKGPYILCSMILLASASEFTCCVFVEYVYHVTKHLKIIGQHKRQSHHVSCDKRSASRCKPDFDLSLVMALDATVGKMLQEWPAKSLVRWSRGAGTFVSILFPPAQVLTQNPGLAPVRPRCPHGSSAGQCPREHVPASHLIPG